MSQSKKVNTEMISGRADYLLALMGHLHQAIDTQLGKTMGSMTSQLTLGQMRTLYYLMEAGPVTMREAANNSGVAMSTMSDMAARLVKLGVAKRCPDPHDRRIVRLEITQMGIKGFASKAKNMRASMKKMLGKYSEKEQQQLIKSLKMVEKILTKE